jgi:hypothetical protein
MTDSVLPKGMALELRTARYFQAQGFLVRRGVTLAVAAGTSDVTDIDLLAIRFTTPLVEDRWIADCKDRTRPKPFERILWTAGLATFSRASQSVVVLPHVQWQAREFATQGGVHILEGADIDQFLYKSKSSYEPFGEASIELATGLELAKKRLPLDVKELTREDLRLRQLLVVGSPLTNLNRTIRFLGSVSRNHIRRLGLYVTYAPMPLLSLP